MAADNQRLTAQGWLIVSRKLDTFGRPVGQYQGDQLKLRYSKNRPTLKPEERAVKLTFAMESRSFHDPDYLLNVEVPHAQIQQPIATIQPPEDESAPDQP